jgi:multidrug resistance efflux pump
VAIGAAVLAALVLGLGLCAARADPGVATARIESGRFVRDVLATGTLQAVRSTPILVPADVEREQRVAALARDGARLQKGDVVVEFDPYQAARESADGRADLAAAAARITKIDAEGGRNARIHALDRDVAQDGLDRAETFQINDETLYSRHAIIESRLERSLLTTRAEAATEQLESSTKLYAADRAIGEIDAGKARVKVATAEKGLRALRILAPHDGLLVLIRNWRGETTFVGDSLWPGEKVAEIPDLSELEARVFVLEADALGLKPGLSASLVIDGHSGPEIPARVSRVEPLAKPRDRQSPVKYFETALSLDHTDASFMRPGQRIRARIVLEQAEAVIAIPRGALFEKDGRRLVYRREGAAFRPVDVTVGRNSLSRVVVESGLARGDVIALRDPTLAVRATPSAGESREGGER